MQIRPKKEAPFAIATREREKSGFTPACAAATSEKVRTVQETKSVSQVALVIIYHRCGVLTSIDTQETDDASDAIDTECNVLKNRKIQKSTFDVLRRQSLLH